MAEDVNSASSNAAQLSSSCVVHIGPGAQKDARPFTETKWEKLRQYTKEWLKTADNCDIDIASRHADFLDKLFADIPGK